MTYLDDIVDALQSETSSVLQNEVYVDVDAIFDGAKV